MQALTLRAGPHALRVLREQGIHPDVFSHMGAAAGGAKWLILNRLDRALFGEWFRGRRKPLTAVGASIGAWRLACAAQKDPLAAIDRFEAAYVEQRYGPKPGVDEVSAEALRILRALLGRNGPDEILAHPWLHLNIIVARARGWSGHPNPFLQRAGLLGALSANLLSRRALSPFFERTILHNASSAPLALLADGFRTQHVPLTADSLVDALMATAAIPMVMSPVRDLSGRQSGAYLDGGMIDYHMDLPLHEPEGLVFLPHFGERVVPGWLDKFLPWRGPRNLDRTLLVAPSREFVERLPQKRIPDRHDFYRYAKRDDARIRDWKTCVAAGQQLADEWMELAAKDRLIERIKPL